MLVKGGIYLEKLANTRAVAFDKTGALTIGKPRVMEVVAFGGDEGALLALAATAESHSEHPLAQVIVAASQAWIGPIGAAQRVRDVFSKCKDAPETTRHRLYLETLEQCMAQARKVIVDTSGGRSPAGVGLFGTQ